MALIDKELNKLGTTIVEGTKAADPPEPIKHFCRSQMSGNYKQEELTLKKIINKELRSTSAAPISLMVYYQNKKVSSTLIKNKHFINPD